MYVLCQSMVRKRIGVGALPVEFLLRQRRILFVAGECFLVFFALLALRWFAGHREF